MFLTSIESAKVHGVGATHAGRAYVKTFSETQSVKAGLEPFNYLPYSGRETILRPVVEQQNSRSNISFSHDGVANMSLYNDLKSSPD